MRRLYVLDTCVLVAAMKSPNGASRVLVEWARLGKLPIVMSSTLSGEYEDVLGRPEIREGAWEWDAAAALVRELWFRAQPAETYFSYRPQLNDPGDELVLEAAYSGNADIVTHNVRDFAPAAARFGIQVFKPGELLEMLKKEDWIDGEE